jgi:glycosyltransferase involved in cell wall biosynthesis
MRVTGVRNSSSLGISRYCGRLAVALAEQGVYYELSERPGEHSHWHLGNSSRRALLEPPRGRFVVTIHDVVPRTRALVPLYRRWAYPLVVRRATALVVHSSFAADLLLREAGADPDRIHVIPHATPRFWPVDRAEARRALGWEQEERVAVMPGVLTKTKLAAEAVEAAEGLPWRVVLLGRTDEPTYRDAIVAADAVLVLRRDSVGESNGPLHDALGAGRAVLATSVGSIPEAAGAAALFCAPEPAAIRAGLERLSSEQSALEAAALERARELSWQASAAAHAELFRAVWDG